MTYERKPARDYAKESRATALLIMFSLAFASAAGMLAGALIQSAWL